MCPVTRRCRREAEDLPLHNAELQDLLAEIMKHKDAWPFVRPVQKIEVIRTVLVVLILKILTDIHFL